VSNVYVAVLYGALLGLSLIAVVGLAVGSLSWPIFSESAREKMCWGACVCSYFCGVWMQKIFTLLNIVSCP